VIRLHKYEEIYFSERRDFPARWNFWADFCRKHSSGKLLDVGCAYGHFLRKAEKYFETYGTDISKHAINTAKTTAPETRFFIQDAEKLNFDDDFFNIITLFDILEHLENPEKCLNKCRKIAKNKALVIISVPNISDKKDEEKWKVLDNTHRSLLYRKEWIKLIGNYIKIESVNSDGFYNKKIHLLPGSLNKMIVCIPGLLQYRIKKLFIPPMGENLIIIGRMVKL